MTEEKRLAAKALLKLYFNSIHLYNSITRDTRYANKVQASVYASLLALSKGQPAIYPVRQTALARQQQYAGKDMPRANYASPTFKPDTSVPKVKMAGAFYGHAGGSVYNNYATKREILKKAYRQATLDAVRNSRKEGLSAEEAQALHKTTMERVKNGIRAVATTQQSFYTERNIRNKIAGITDYLGFADYNKSVARSVRADYRAQLTKLQNDPLLKYVPKSHTNIIREAQGVKNFRSIQNINRRFNIATYHVGKHFQTHGTKYAIAGAVIGAGILAYRNRGTIATYAGDKRVQASLHNLKEKALVGSGFAVAGHYLAQSKNTFVQFSGRIVQGLGSGLIISALAHTTNTVLNKPRMDVKDAAKVAKLKTIEANKAVKEANKAAKLKTIEANKAAKTKSKVDRATWNKHISEGLKGGKKSKHIR